MVFFLFRSAVLAPWPASVMVLSRGHQLRRQSAGAAAPVSGMLGPVMMMMPLIMIAPTATTSVKKDKKKNRTSQVTFGLATTPFAGASSTSALSVDSLATSATTTELGAPASSSTAEVVHTEDAEVENKFQQTSRFKLEDISHFAENVGRFLLTGSLFHFLFFSS